MRLFDSMKEWRSFSALLLSFGVLQIAAYYLMGATIRADGGFALPHPDTLLYMQAARRICEGAPFSFSAGTAASTGTTSVLYPFVLAVPYALGCVGDALIRGGFVINAAFYLLFLFCWGRIAFDRLESAGARFVALALLAFSPQSVFCALSQSDTGFWMAVSALFALSLHRNDLRLSVPLLMLAPWVRPEGMICVFSFLVVATIRRNRREIGWGVLALASVLAVFVFNAALTGACQFSSVANKGYLKNYGLFRGLYQSGLDFVRMLRELILGIPISSPRDLFILPVIGAALMGLGVFTHDWHRRGVSREFVWLLAVGGGFALVATSGWQDTNADRYLAWTYPTLALFVAEGAYVCETRAKGFGFRYLPAILTVAFAVCASGIEVCAFRLVSERMDRTRAFAVRCEETMTRTSAIGVWGRCGIAYEMDSRRVAHLGGIYSPEFPLEAGAETFETLKRNPELRFYYYFHDPADESRFGFNSLGTVSEQILVGPHGMELRKMLWAPFDAAAVLPRPPKEGLKLADAVDVAYGPDERRASYEPFTDYGLDLPPPFAEFGRLGETDIVEGGRVLFGGDEMSVALEPGKDVTVIMRTLSSRTLVLSDAFAHERRTVSFSSPMELHLEVDGEEVGHATFRLNEKGFTDAVITIPGAAIRRSPCRVGFHGDHIACAYWYYQ